MATVPWQLLLVWPRGGREGGREITHRNDQCACVCLCVHACVCVYVCVCVCV